MVSQTTIAQTFSNADMGQMHAILLKTFVHLLCIVLRALLEQIILPILIQQSVSHRACRHNPLLPLLPTNRYSYTLPLNLETAHTVVIMQPWSASSSIHLSIIQPITDACSSEFHRLVAHSMKSYFLVPTGGCLPRQLYWMALGCGVTRGGGRVICLEGCQVHY